MGYIDLLDYIKMSQDKSSKNDSRVRFKIFTDRNDRLMLERSAKFNNRDMGAISVSPIMTRSQGDIVFDGLPSGIATIQDLDSVLKDTMVEVYDHEKAPSVDDIADIQRKGDLGASRIEFMNHTLDPDNYGGDSSLMFMPLLETSKLHRGNGYAKLLLHELSKYSRINGYKAVSGVGSPLEATFDIQDKTDEELKYIDEYLSKYKDKDIKSIIPSANLALFYKRLGYDIRPLGRFFVVEKSVKKTPLTVLDREYFSNARTSLDEGENVLLSR